MRRAVAAGLAVAGLGLGALFGVLAGVLAVTSVPANAPAPEPYVCIDGGDGQPGWACYLRTDAPAVEPGQKYVVTTEPHLLPNVS